MESDINLRITVQVPPLKKTRLFVSSFGKESVPLVPPFGKGGLRGIFGALGFTLIEILVALAILAGSFLALVKISGGYTRQVAYLTDKTCAYWVAENLLTDASLKEWPALGKTEGFAKMGAQDWYWEQKVLETSDSALRRLEVGVRNKKKEGADFLVTLVGFAGQTQNKKKAPGP